MSGSGWQPPWSGISVAGAVLLALALLITPIASVAGSSGPTAHGPSTGQNATPVSGSQHAALDQPEADRFRDFHGPPHSEECVHESSGLNPRNIDVHCDEALDGNESYHLNVKATNSWLGVLYLQIPDDVSSEELAFERGSIVFEPVYPNSTGSGRSVIPLEKRPVVRGNLDVGPDEIAFPADLYPVYPTRPMGPHQYRLGPPEVQVWTLELEPGVYDARVVLYEPEIYNRDILPESALQTLDFGMQNNPRSEATMTLGVGGCVPGYDAESHYRQLQREEIDALDRMQEAEETFEQAQNQYGINWAFVGAGAGLSIVVAQAGAPVVVVWGAQGYALASDLTTILNQVLSVERARRLAQNIVEANRDAQRAVEGRIQILEEIARCHGEEYTLPEHLMP